MEVTSPADCPSLFPGTFHGQVAAATLKRIARQALGMMPAASSCMALPGRRAKTGNCVIEGQPHSMRVRISLS